MSDLDGARARPLAVVGLVALALGTFVFITAETMPIALLTWMAPSLGTSPQNIALAVTGYGFLVAAISIPMTRVTIKLPRKQLMCAAFALFAASCAASAASLSYEMLLVSRAAAAISHAVFWSLVAPTAVALFPGANRGRVIAVVFVGSGLGPVAGVPVMTWVGDVAGWRPAFWIITAIASLITAALWVSLPSTSRKDEAHTTGSAPDRRGYRTVLVVTAIVVTAVFIPQTFVTLFLEQASGFAPSQLAPVLLVAGLAGVLGVVGAGWLVERRPQAALVTALTLSVVSMLAVYWLAELPWAAVVLVAARACAFSALGTIVQVRVMTLTPGSTDIASAASSSVFNLGIGAGALLGGLAVTSTGVASTALFGGLLALASLALYLAAARSRSGTPVSPTAAR